MHHAPAGYVMDGGGGTLHPCPPPSISRALPASPPPQPLPTHSANLEPLGGPHPTPLIAGCWLAGWLADWRTLMAAAVAAAGSYGWQRVREGRPPHDRTTVNIDIHRATLFTATRLVHMLTPTPLLLPARPLACFNPSPIPTRPSCPVLSLVLALPCPCLPPILPRARTYAAHSKTHTCMLPLLPSLPTPLPSPPLSVVPSVVIDGALVAAR